MVIPAPGIPYYPPLAVDGAVHARSNVVWNEPTGASVLQNPDGIVDIESLFDGNTVWLALAVPLAPSRRIVQLTPFNPSSLGGIFTVLPWEYVDPADSPEDQALLVKFRLLNVA